VLSRALRLVHSPARSPFPPGQLLVPCPPPTGDLVCWLQHRNPCREMLSPPFLQPESCESLLVKVRSCPRHLKYLNFFVLLKEYIFPLRKRFRKDYALTAYAQ
jgi:hypothetical protein